MNFELEVIMRITSLLQLNYSAQDTTRMIANWSTSEKIILDTFSWIFPYFLTDPDPQDPVLGGYPDPHEKTSPTVLMNGNDYRMIRTILEGFFSASIESSVEERNTHLRTWASARGRAPSAGTSWASLAARRTENEVLDFRKSILGTDMIIEKSNEPDQLSGSDCSSRTPPWERWCRCRA